MTPAPFTAADLIQAVRESAYNLAAAILLAWGAVAELRSRKEAAVLNPLIYAVSIMTATAGTVSAYRGTEFILWLVLVSDLLFLLVPAIGLMLYRCEIGKTLGRLRNAAR